MQNDLFLNPTVLVFIGGLMVAGVTAIVKLWGASQQNTQGLADMKVRQDRMEFEARKTNDTLLELRNDVKWIREDREREKAQR